MGRFTQLICQAAVTAIFAAQGFAAEPVTPPFFEPQEEWVLTYDNYKSNVNSMIPRNLSRDVYIVRDNDNLYIKGIFPEYPEAWIKGTVSNDRLLFQDSQIIAVDGEENEYFHCGQASFVWSQGNTTEYEHVEFIPSELTFNISEDGNTFTVVNADLDYPENYGSFWYSDKENGKIRYWQGKKWLIEVGIGNPTVSGTGFPDVDYMIYMKLYRKDESGIEGIGSEQVDDTVAPMYDLQGRMVNPETARPGIYIQNGKKILIR